MIRTFCDCCGAEITSKNSPANGESDTGRLKGKVMTKPGISACPFVQVEVIVAKGSTWNGGHFCKYCVIDAIDTLDDRPKPDVVPRQELQRAETLHANLLMDLQRLIDGEEPLNSFAEVEKLRDMLWHPNEAAQ